LWKATLVGWQGVPIEAYLSIPKAEGKFPVDINVYPASGIDPENVPMSSSTLHLRVSPRGFGTHDAERKPKGSPYVTDDPDPRNFYVLANVLDWMRGLDWAVSEPKADPNRVFLGGGSRGGYLTMMIAAADPRIAVANAAVPCYADLELMARLGYSSAAADAYHALYGGSKERQESMRKVWGYFDAANVAHRIKCPIVIEAGMTDKICPAPGIVDAYNRIPIEEKYLFLNPEQGHTGTRNGGAIRNMLKARAGMPEENSSQSESP
jgi:cephalosporin-C deacetylase